MRRGRLLLILAVTGVLLLVAEGVARALDDELAPLLRYHSYEADLKVERMDDLHDEGGAAIAFVGTSLVYGIDPTLLPRSVDGRAAGYNASLASGIPTLVRPWAIRSVLPRLEPDLLVLGLTSYELSDDPAAVAFTEAFVGSDGARRDADDDGLLDGADRWLGEHSSLWAHRSSLRDPELLLDAARGQGFELDALTASLQPSGRPAFRERTRFEDRLQPGGGNLSRWEIGTENVAAVRGLVRDARAAGVEVALVNMPVTPEYVARHPDGAADYEEYRAFLRELAEEEDVALVDAHGVSDHAWFADEVHLNLEGARVLTPLLVDALRAHGLLDDVLVVERR
jgi:hypothetical protein